ncbi:MAG TPA: hypothetical protein VLZ05_01525 [Mycobacterium sp.]|nr:hypothetical protein [Mycobacterium sp.]HUH67657.1 hypothetical protein [Mycobacterium sp.]
MSATLVRSLAEYATVTLTLGQLKSIYPHKVWHNEPRIELRFEHGSISMSADSLNALVSQAKYALTRRTVSDYPGAVTQIKNAS